MGMTSADTLTRGRDTELIYMDHAATSPISESALEEMLRSYREGFGNPSAIYSTGQTAKNASISEVIRVPRSRRAESCGQKALRPGVRNTTSASIPSR